MADEETLNPAGAPAATDVSDPAAAETAAARGGDEAVLKRERDDYYDRLLRTTAEFDNYRRRIERERRDQADQAVIDLLLELLLVVDDFDRALMVEPGEGETAAAYRKGIELIYAKLQDLLRKRGVTALGVLGKDFDPNVHQAVMHEASPEHREGEVIGELRRGYLIGDRLLRPAMVKVAKA